MNLIIFGASSDLGKALIRQALQREQQVTAFVRDPQSLEIKHPGLALAQGDVLDGASLRRGLAGQAAAISVLSARRGAGGLLLAEGIANLVQACQEAGVMRLVCLASVGWQPAWTSKAQRAEEEVIQGYLQASALEWTLVRVGRLSGAARTGRYRVSPGGSVKWGFMWAGYADLVDFLLDEVEQSIYPQQIVTVTSG